MQTIHLQAIGKTKAKPAGDLVAGDVTVWNFGSTAKVIGKASETKAYVTMTLQDKESGTYERRLKKSRLVGIQ